MLLLVPVQPSFALVFDRKNRDRMVLESQDEAKPGLELQSQGEAKTEASNERKKCLVKYCPSDPTALVVQSVAGAGEGWVEAIVVVLDNSMTVEGCFDREYYHGMQRAKEAMDNWKQSGASSRF